jgi:hypothetical protein
MQEIVVEGRMDVVSGIAGNGRKTAEGQGRAIALVGPQALSVEAIAAQAK